MAAVFKFSTALSGGNVLSICGRRLTKIASRSPRINFVNSKASYHFGNIFLPGVQRPSISAQFYLRPFPRLVRLQQEFSILSHGRHSFPAMNPKLLGKELYATSWRKTRSITIMSKLGKRKTCKAVAKRFHRTGKGKLKRWRAGKNHNMMNKTNKRRKQLKKPTYVSKQQLKLLNQMLNGW